MGAPFAGTRQTAFFCDAQGWLCLFASTCRVTDYLRISGLFLKPTHGLEPRTPSLRAMGKLLLLKTCGPARGLPGAYGIV